MKKKELTEEQKERYRAAMLEASSNSLPLLDALSEEKDSIATSAKPIDSTNTENQLISTLNKKGDLKMDGKYLNEFHKQQSLKAQKVISETPRMSLEESIEQYHNLKRMSQQRRLKEEKEAEK